MESGHTLLNHQQVVAAVPAYPPSLLAHAKFGALGAFYRHNDELLHLLHLDTLPGSQLNLVLHIHGINFLLLDVFLITALQELGEFPEALPDPNHEPFASVGRFDFEFVL